MDQSQPAPTANRYRCWAPGFAFLVFHCFPNLTTVNGEIFPHGPVAPRASSLHDIVIDGDWEERGLTEIEPLGLELAPAATWRAGRSKAGYRWR